MTLAESETDGEASCYYQVTWESRFNPPKEVGKFCYDPINKSLTMVNKDTALQRRVLLLGYTSKKEDQRASLIGQFGKFLYALKLVCMCVCTCVMS